MTKADTLKLALGTMVFCTVRLGYTEGRIGWRRLNAIRPRDGYIKVNGFNTWNPPHNFALVDDKGRDWSKATEF